MFALKFYLVEKIRTLVAIAQEGMPHVGDGYGIAGESSISDMPSIGNFHSLLR